ncbi:NADH-quinone oxidoreductase subunit J [Alphaproteobacteria bacterium 46_93_T64]|nr:NADH-quinone oxidoreductase subunit J [Alphaproteobacteria bacterium 46_93_T64]
MEQAFFILVAVVAVGSGVLVVAARNPIHSALALMVCFVQIAAVFLLLRSPILAVIQMFVYVGAVIVLFLFVIMMMDVREEARIRFMRKGTKLTVAGIFFLGVEMITLFLGSEYLFDLTTSARKVEMSTVDGLGTTLFTEYLFPFEVASVILLAALVGAIILTRRARGTG